MRLPCKSVALVSVLLATACGSGGRHHGAEQSAAPVKYTGPAIPGLEPKPIWSVPDAPFVSAIGLSRTFAVLLGHQGESLALIDAMSGHLIGDGRPLSEPDPTSGGHEQTLLLRDSHHGGPVVVVRYKENVPASGMQDEYDQDSDLVVDESGRQVWRSPTDGTGQGRFFVGGYIAKGEVERSAGPDEGYLTKVTTLTASDGGKSVSTGASEYDDDEAVYGATNGKIVHTMYNILGRTGLEGLDASTGKPAWKLKGATFYGMFGNLLLTMGDQDVSGRTQQVTFTDPASGRQIATAKVPEFGCRTALLDKDSGSVLCAGEHVIALDSATAKVRWQQPPANARDLQPRAAAGGAAYLELDGSNDESHTFVAVNDRTGQVLADNLAIDGVTTADNGIAMVAYQGALYGFRVKKLS